MEIHHLNNVCKVCFLCYLSLELCSVKTDIRQIIIPDAFGLISM